MNEPITITLHLTGEEALALMELLSFHSSSVMWKSLSTLHEVRDPARLPHELAQRYREAVAKREQE